MSVVGGFSRVAQRFPPMLGFGRAEEGPPPVPVVRSRRRHFHPRAGGPPLRRPAVAVLAVPVIASIYFALLLARPARRYLAATIAVVLVGALGVGLAAPAPASSIPPSTNGLVPAALFHPVETGLSGASQADAAVASAIASASAEPATAVAVGSTGDGAAAAAITAPDVLRAAPRTSTRPRSCRSASQRR